MDKLKVYYYEAKDWYTFRATKVQRFIIIGGVAMVVGTIGYYVFT